MICTFRAITLPVSLVAALWSGAVAVGADEPIRPLPQAHSHNDYYRRRPLLDALDRGFGSVEADVFLEDGELLVGHYKIELRPERSLRALYLEPLRERVAANGGSVYPGGPRLTLLVDFKTDGEAAYEALAALLAEYDDVVSGMNDGKWTPRAVEVVISGDRPIEAITSDPHRRVAIDGRFADTPAEAPADLVPLISEDWGRHFAWRGAGEMPDDQRLRLRELAAQADAQGRRLRFWGAGDQPAVWREMVGAGVDVLGADNLDALQRFLQGEDQ